MINKNCHSRPEQVFELQSGQPRWLVTRPHIKLYPHHVLAAVTRQRQLSTATERPTHTSR